VDFLAEERNFERLRDCFLYAEKMHRNFYDNTLDVQTINSYKKYIEELLKIVEEMNVVIRWEDAEEFFQKKGQQLVPYKCSLSITFIISIIIT
jgi:hypothetical protein